MAGRIFIKALPGTANLNAGGGGTAYAAPAVDSQGAEPAVASAVVWLQVDIPCPGHTPLIMGELKNLEGIGRVVYAFPNNFDVWYDEASLLLGEIVSLEVFDIYKARVIRR